MTATRNDHVTLLEALAAMPRADREQRIRSTGPPDEVVIALATAAEHLAADDTGRALTATGYLIDLADSLCGPAARARVRCARAGALCNSGRLEEGWLACDEAARIAIEGEQPLEAGLARLRSMQALGELGRFDESVAAGKTALAAFRAAGSNDLVARAQVNIGAVFQRRDNPRRALEYFDRAKPLLGETPQSLGIVDNNRGEALLALNDFAGAEAAFESALDHLRSIDATLAAAVVEGNLADLAARQGLLHSALYHFEQARRRLETTQSTGHLMRLLTEQAEAIGVLGLPGDALREYESALPQLDRAGQVLEAARARAGMGRVLVRLNRLAEAETALAASARAYDQLGHGSARARVDLVRAELAAANGLSAEARRLVHDALTVLHDHPVDAAAARHQLARLAFAEEDLDTAAVELAAAMRPARGLDLAPLLADLLHTAARLHAARHEHDAAVKNLEAALGQVERVRGTLQGERFRAAFLGDRLAVYDDLFEALLDQGSAERAFAVAERAKSRQLLEQLRGELARLADSGTGRADPHERRLVEELARLRAELNALYSRVADGGPGAELDDRWRSAVVEHERGIEEIESRLSATAGLAGLYASTATLEETLADLPSDATLIEYVVSAGWLTAFVATRGDCRVFRHLARADTLDERMARLQFQINRPLRRGGGAASDDQLVNDARAELAAIESLVLSPLRDAIPQGNTLIIVPHGALHLLPFHALWDGQRHLIETNDVVYLPSASVMLQLGERDENESTPAGKPLVVGVADERAPHIDEEARRVALSLGCDPGELLLGTEATAERFCAAAADAGLVHLACHARFEPRTPMGSGVRLADRWLTVRDIYSMQLAADHVTLSGCETGRSRVRAGDELMGLLRGFFAAGARSLLVSMWRVDDESAAELMDRFYLSWNSGSPSPVSRAAALRDAQIVTLRRRPHPAFWAPFRLVGRP